MGDKKSAESAAKPATLHLFADIDVKELGVSDLKSGNVGHTWVSLEWKDPAAVPSDIQSVHLPLLKQGGQYADPMGFWPDTENGVYYSVNPAASWVQGKMRHPDRAHEGMEKASQSWEVTRSEADAVIAYAESKRGAKYSVYFYNCTTFGKEAVEAAGKSPPSMSTMGICFPNALYDGIRERQEDGKGTTMVQDMDTGKRTTARNPDGKR